MSDLIHLEIVTPVGMIFKGDVKLVILPGSEGEFGVLKGHASLIASLKAGVIDVQKEDDAHEFIAIDSGYAEVNELSISVIAKGAVAINSGPNSEVSKNLAAAKELIESMGSDSAALAATFAQIDNKLGTR